MTAAANWPMNQNQPTENPRTCGATCLSRVYRSLGLQVSQDEIWAAVSKPNRRGSLSSTTHLMTQDALQRGFHAVAIQARHPLQALRQCRAFEVSAILNHRMEKGSASGHYSVLSDITADTVVLYDPLLSGTRKLSHLEFLELWVPLGMDSEISGNVLIAISAGGGPPASAIVCPLCSNSLESAIECPQCQAKVSLRPRAVLACANNSCLARLWNQVCCPACDFLWDFSTSKTAPDAKASRSGAELPKTFSALDKFTELLEGIPQAADHPDLRKHLDFLVSSKQTLKLAVARDLAQRALQLGQIAELQRTVEQKRSQQQKKVDELNQPMAALDGNELGWALLRNLGLAKS